MGTFALLTGTVDGEPETKEVGQDKKKVTNFRVACDPGWYTVNAWGDLGDKVPAAGEFVVVTGRLSGRSYESNRYKDSDGKAAKISVVEITASSIEAPGSGAADDDGMFAD